MVEEVCCQWVLRHQERLLLLSATKLALHIFVIDDVVILLLFRKRLEEPWTVCATAWLVAAGRGARLHGEWDVCVASSLLSHGCAP